MRAAFVFVLCAGCAGSVEVTRTVSPGDVGANMTAQAIVRGSERIDLPAGTHVQRGRAVLAGGTVADIALDGDDAVVRDASSQIVAVKSHGEISVRFADGANMIDAKTVRGEVAEIPLRKGDEVEVHGVFSPGDDLPGGGRVESSRWTGSLIGGIAIFALSYAPSAYIGAQSQSDRSLLVPIAGPWIDLANRPACSVSSQVTLAASSVGVDPCIGDTAIRIALVASGVAQGLGGLLTVLGLPSHSEITQGDRHSAFHVSLVPSGLGAAAVGTF